MKHLIPETSPDYDHTRIIERPDGFYWTDADSGEEYGPFSSLLEAVQDMEYSAESDFEPGETVELMVFRQGKERTIDVTLGDRSVQFANLTRGGQRGGGGNVPEATPQTDLGLSVEELTPEIASQLSAEAKPA